ncbi:probable calcium-binding protein CML43 [Nymphaea colorata]|uniref:EF-hand domain-containing protein n=1 Tax=Nymphaea colorata TaxID=210225 RepID=A0A5K1DPA9_9MAGN|nr:probable calcium-binding protein CML43 [Nymphaea colorata]
MSTGTAVQRTPSLAKRPPPSFRLRNPSLNTLRLRRIFDSFDENGDGEISVDELRRAFGRLGLETDRSELKEVVCSIMGMEANGSPLCSLDFDGFVALHRSIGDGFFGSGGDGEGECETDESDLSEAFKVFDEDGDGVISAPELQSVLGKLGLGDGYEIEGVRQMIKSVDRNHDGHVDFQEFKIMMRNVVAKSN